MSLAGLCITTGIVYGVLYLPMVMAPGLARKGLQVFPRNIWAGGILAALALAWAAWELNDMPLGAVDAYKTWLWVAGPLVYLLVMVFMNELLAPRALGGLLMLSASPLLEAQRVCDSGWTVIPALLAYIWVVTGMVLVLSPFRFRQAMELCCGTDAACRWTGIAGQVLAVFMVGLGLMVF